MDQQGKWLFFLKLRSDWLKTTRLILRSSVYVIQVEGRLIDWITFSFLRHTSHHYRQRIYFLRSIVGSSWLNVIHFSWSNVFRGHPRSDQCYPVCISASLWTESNRCPNPTMCGGSSSGQVIVWKREECKTYPDRNRFNCSWRSNVSSFWIICSKLFLHIFTSLITIPPESSVTHLFERVKVTLLLPRKDPDACTLKRSEPLTGNEGRIVFISLPISSVPLFLYLLFPSLSSLLNEKPRDFATDELEEYSINTILI